MFKRIFAALICLPFALAGFAAQLTATLQSGDSFTPFYGENAFVEAYNAAVDGDVITLSPGSFKTTEIKKGITLIGTYAFSGDISEATVIPNLVVSGNNVNLEAIRIANILAISGADKLSINRSFLYKVEDIENGEKKYHDNTVLSDCMVVGGYDAMSLSKNAVFRNCCINYFTDCNEAGYPALIENCNIPLYKKWNSTLYSQPYAVYRSCLLGLYKDSSDTNTPSLHLYSPSEFHDIFFFSNFYYTSTSNYSKAWDIKFNSAIHENAIKVNSWYSIGTFDNSYGYSHFSSYTYEDLTVGPSDVKEYPAIPLITESKIDAKTDEDGNLHVKISATARD